ncbi:MAG: bifunctional phosphoribosylaminoimidazolecarboxamide formyltransferase/inosine monophosphate cyclohydrolase [Rickettsiales bacterium]|nr:bifunctional phosphoribosylaminoimidazolecarboxamide formyltransferase/inosine monophosphate cyclohydrolase [Rickettsiales bacterium]
MSQKIKNALISLSDKSGIEKILKTLRKYNIKIISSGGTYKEIKKLGYNCTEISKYTKFSEMLDGRVKTLHPKIHAGILGKRSDKKHKREMNKRKFNYIDLIIVNFYPFQETIQRTKNYKKIIENIDIGGPAMVRGAAKNFSAVSIITDKKDYGYLISELNKNKGATSLKFREQMASKAFGLTAYYDSVISNWFNKKLNIIFPEKKTIFGKKITQLRYGENPHQRSSIYLNDLFDEELGLKKIRGKALSYNNYNDIFTGLEILSSFKKTGSVIIKHANPSGASINTSPIKSFRESYASDPISAFGGVVACNFKINKKIAKEISKIFFEVILAKKFDKEALRILSSKKNLILIDISKFKHKKEYQIKQFNNSFLIQDRNKTTFKNKDLKFVTKLKPTKKEIRSAEFALNICKFVKSNSIIITNNFSTIGIGAGQPSRVDSCKIAVEKAKKFQLKKLKNSIAASDAFFPFSDGVKKLIKAGVKLIIQPGGSKRDEESISAANKAKIKMIFTGIRHFNH